MIEEEDSPAVNYHVVFDVSQKSSQLAIWAINPVFALLPGLIG